MHEMDPPTKPRFQIGGIHIHIFLQGLLNRAARG